MGSAGGKPASGNLLDLASGKPLVRPGSGERTILPEIMKIAGLDVLAKAIYVEQGQIAELIQAAPAQRKKTIGHMLGIDMLEQFWEAMKEPCNIVRQEINTLAVRTQLIDVVKKQLSEKRQQIASLQETLTKTAEEADKTKQEVESLKAMVSQLEERKKSSITIEKQILELQTEKQTMQSQLNSLGEKIQRIHSAQQDLVSSKPNIDKVEESRQLISPAANSPEKA
ncbi:MAG: hypothetical protein QXR26_04950 [Candidatus Caldarchaeum sp.]